ncbi:hypothetical protein [Streptomyces sp. CB01881]|uniref:hypothetical protein n=1 Tax=Streptomyces sp. CB01881 TaxID=2078691 RepID=UPI000CDC3E9C|nr:hypothetical protein [Streptomyces sp. CB01881]AUY52318.1 hypothetical protein C2142_29155 [Streptomyces sp. CB01881]TYC71740.1 hypothetical protein EH183_29130 [Streptomyces sp. CB01881]
MRARNTTTFAVLTALALTVPVLAVSPAVAAPTAASGWSDSVTDAGGFVGMAPTRMLDTRTDNTPNHSPRTPIGPGEHYVALLQGDVIPHGATAVVVNVTATNQTATGYLTLGGGVPAGGGAPETSSLNFIPGQTISNLVTVALGQGTGRPTVDIFNSAGRTDVILDVVGYYQPGAGDEFAPLTPTRVTDTRTDSAGPIGGRTTRSIKVARPELGTADARAVVLSVTATESTADTFVTVYPGGTARPAEGSNINVPIRRSTPNQVVVPVGEDGRINIYNNAGAVNVVVDVVGYYGPSGTGLFRALKQPVRQFDSRVAGRALGYYETRRIAVLSSDGSTPDVVAVETNVTATNVSTPGHLTVYPGPNRPDTSNLNVEPATTSANSVTTGLNGGTFSVFNAGGPLDLITDLTGFFTTG